MSTVARHSLREILYPESIAIIGASKDPTKRGFRSIQKLLEDHYPGAIYPVNPRQTEILGLPCHARVTDIPGDVDLALICTAAKTLPELIAQCGRKGVKGAVVLAGGFAEEGEAGARLQQEMVRVAHATGVRIIGPNTSGIFNTHKACNVVGFSNLRKGTVGLLSQSGNMALSLVTEAEANGYVGLSTYIGIGNESDIEFHEYLDYFAADENTSVVIAYVEGMRDGRAFLDALRRVTRSKPVVIYKSGRTNAGRSSAKSHTGALAGDYAVSEGVLRQAGAIIVQQSDEILSVAETLSLLEPLASRRVAVLADGGGHATIAADALSERGLVLAELSPETQRRLRALLPPAAAVGNPVDVTGGTDTNPALFGDCARILLEDPQVDGLLITGLYGGYGVRFSNTLTGIELAAADALATLHRRVGKPILVHSLYGSLYADLRPAPLTHLREIGIPVYDSLELAVRCLQALAEFGESRQREPDPANPSCPRNGVFEEILATCRREGRTVVLESEARRALEATGVQLLPALTAHDADEAAAAFARLGHVPVALKIISRDIIHKSDAGGVRLGLTDAHAVRLAFDGILASVRHHCQDARVTGVMVTPMAPPGGIEVIIGVTHDPTYGPIMMFGLGGILVEVLKDVVFRALPLDRTDARSMLDDIRAHEILNGVRGAPPADKQALIELMLAVSSLALAFPEIAEIDLNPVLVYPKGVWVLDTRFLLGESVGPA